MDWSNAFVSYGPGRKAPSGSLADQDLLARLRQYKRFSASRYRVLSPADLRDKGPQGKLWISTKVDGELWFLIKRDDDVALCAYNGRIVHGVPLTDEARRLLAPVRSAIVAGELLGIPAEGRPRVMHVGHALSDGAYCDMLAFRAFDLVEEDGADALARPYQQRYERLRELFSGGQRASLVTTVEGDAAAAYGYYREWVAAQGMEGIVVRTDFGTTIKIKPSFSLDAVVVAFGERHVQGVAEMGELAVAVVRDDGTFQIVGAVGIGWTAEEQLALHQRLTASRVASTFRLPGHDGLLCRFVRPELVVEIKCNELVDTDTADEPIRRMVLRYDEAGYHGIGLMPVATLVFPVFIRERTDKPVDAASAGLDQIFQRVPFEDRHQPAAPVVRPASTVLRRQVWTKRRDGLVAVRKYVAIQTHKSGDYPPFVVHFTDYSAGRAEPLKTTLRVASTEAKLASIVREWTAENVKRGWQEVQAPEPATAEPPTERG